jgi:hypothetical protein
MRLISCSLMLLWLATAEAQAQGIVEFVQDDCPACRRTEPLLARLENSGVRVVRYRASAADPVCRTLGIRTTPTFIAVDRHGREVQRLVGITNEAALQSLARRAYSIR